MLQHLSVDNFILIPRLEIDFHRGFTCITGETGAGKSILVGALSLILGQRADTGVLRDKEKKCIIEGRFRIEEYGLEPFFQNHDLDYEPISVFRREITPQGKSRAFINDTPVNLTVMKEVGDRLVDIHSQHQTLELNEASFQLGMIDAYAANAPSLSICQILFNEYERLKMELDDCQLRQNQAESEMEYLNFQLDELEKANLTAGEQDLLEEELEILTHAEEISSRTFTALGLLSENEPNVYDVLAEVRSQIDQAARHSHALMALSERLSSSMIEIKDIITELRNHSEQIHFDPARIENLQNRLGMLYHLEQKHRVSSVEELILLQESLTQKRDSAGSLTSRILELTELLKRKENELSEVSVVISQQRKTVIPGIEAEMQAVLQSLGMPSARFEIRHESLDHFTASGTDKMEFLFSANKGGEASVIRKVASGGELSRLMLALKSLVLNRSLLPVVLFDEIDSGVSGEIAGRVGEIMKTMSRKMQVIAITHLPQIAGKADSHLLAYKQDGALSTVSSMKVLTQEERINEIARMLSNETITESARNTAKELLSL
jgi:DNA repair protein RecN (Recombination protein N)